MNSGKSIFAQLMDFLPSYEFRQCVERYQGNYKLQSFSCWDQFLCMAFAQLTYRESLRDIEACLRANQTKLYHLGIRGRVSRNTLANANSARDWRIYADFAHLLINQARALYATTISAWHCSKLFTRWMPRPSICVCRCFPGPTFANAKGPSNCTLCSTCVAIFLR